MGKREHKVWCPFMGLLVRRVVEPSLPMDGPENRTRLGMLAGWASAVLSIFLTVAKAWFGFVSGSVSMMADATNNLTDVGSSLVIALGFQWSRKPRDEEHPFGHGRIEAVVTLILAIALVLVGAEVAKSGVLRLIKPEPIEAPFWMLVAVGVTVVVKIWMAIFARALAKLSKSKVLEADAWNHTFDIVCTLMVVVALVSSHFGWGAVDGWTAVGVALFILYTGISYGREAIDILLGQKPDPDAVRKIHDVALSVDKVMGTHEIMVHHYGDVHMVSFHIEVDARLSLVEAHWIAEVAEEAVESTLGWRAVVHVDPVDRTHTLFEELNQFLHAYVEKDHQLVDVHDLRAEGGQEPYRISFDLVTSMEVKRSEYDGIYSRTLLAAQDYFENRVDCAEIGIEAVVESEPMVRKVFDLKGS